MSILGLRKQKAASPWMLVVSASLHGLLIIGIIVAASGLFKPPDPQEKVVIPVFLPPPGPPEIVKLADTDVQETEVSPLEKTDTAKDVETPARQIVAPKKLASKSSELIKVKKRKRKPKRVASRTPKKPKKKKKPKQKKEDPNAYLTRRLAALRDKMKQKKPAPDKAAKEDSGAGASAAESSLSDEHIARWFNGVRDRVNAHWTVLPGGQALHRVTLVGVRLADNGNLLDATVDKSSGDPLFDRSAMRAIYQAAPFPPVPPRIRATIRKEGGLALKFTPRGMQ